MSLKGKQKTGSVIRLVLIHHILIWSLISTTQLLAQDLSFVNYSTKDGLSSAQVYHIFQDKNGDMLFATDRGITKYDGYKFEIYSKADGLTNTTVFKFFPQSDGTIWCSTIDNSWFYFKNGTTKFTPCPINSTIQKYSNGGQAENLWIDKNMIYFGFEDIADFLSINSSTNSVIHPLTENSIGKDSLEAVFVINPKSAFNYVQFLGENKKEWGRNSLKILRQSCEKSGYKKLDYVNGKFLFSTYTHLIISDASGKQKELNLEAKILALGKYDDSHFYVGLLEGGIRIFDMDGIEKQQWLVGASPTHLFKDKDGGVWISTLDDGIYFSQNESIKFLKIHDEPFIYSISPGENKLPLISTFSHHYLVENEKLNTLQFRNEYPGSKVFYDSKTNLYIQFIRSFIWQKSLVDNQRKPVLDFSEDQNLPIVISSSYAFFNLKNGQYHIHHSKTRITAIENAEIGVLVGGYNGIRFYSYDKLSSKSINYEPLKGRIKDIKLKGKYHFIGTNESGLVRYNQKGNKFLNITKKDGLASDLINEVYPESESVIWVATNFGLDRVTFFGDRYKIKHFGIEHGLQDNDITDVYIHNNVIWIGTRSGLFSLKKVDFESTSKSVNLNLFWKKVQVNQIIISNPSKLILDHTDNNLEFEFHSSFYGGNSRVKYRYKIMDGKDVWHYLKNRNILLNGLQPGEYKIILQGKVDEMNWTKNQLFIEFIINPPYYQTWWFRALITTLFLFLIYLFFRFRVLIYNKSLVKEALRLIIRKLNPQLKSFIIIEQGKKHRINSMDILYLKSEGNYMDIYLNDRKHTIRHKIGEYNMLVPDKIEYIRVHKSYVVRIDKITGKNIDFVFIDKIEVPIGKTYKDSVKELTI